MYDCTTDRCYYIPANELGEGRKQLLLRLTPPKNSQRAKIRFAEKYLALGDPPQVRFEMELAGRLSNPRLHLDRTVLRRNRQEKRRPGRSGNMLAM